jgi:3-phenylpropionate/trans-cinnamate dioxygenase ferredoxin reductase subunit
VAEHIVIVGASLAGMYAAQTLRRQGFDGRVTVVDADPHTPYDKPPLSKQVLAGEWEADRLVLTVRPENPILVGSRSLIETRPQPRDAPARRRPAGGGLRQRR